jgi:hypothetical protein
MLCGPLCLACDSLDPGTCFSQWKLQRSSTESGGMSNPYHMPKYVGAPMSDIMVFQGVKLVEIQGLGRSARHPRVADGISERLFFRPSSEQTCRSAARVLHGL